MAAWFTRFASTTSIIVSITFTAHHIRLETLSFVFVAVMATLPQNKVEKLIGSQAECEIKIKQ